MGARLLPRTLPELFSYCLSIEGEAARRYADVERFLRGVGVEDVADEFEKMGREEQEQYHLIKLGTSGRELPEVAGWELAWHFLGGETARPAPRSTRDAIASALAFERRAQAFYFDVAGNARDGAVRAFSVEMANDEQRHIARLELLLERATDAAGPEEGLAVQGSEPGP